MKKPSKKKRPTAHAMKLVDDLIVRADRFGAVDYMCDNNRRDWQYCHTALHAGRERLLDYIKKLQDRQHGNN